MQPSASWGIPSFFRRLLPVPVPVPEIRINAFDHDNLDVNQAAFERVSARRRGRVSMLIRMGRSGDSGTGMGTE